MLAFARFVFAAVAIGALSAQGAPWPLTSKHATHRTRAIVDGAEIQAYQPLSTFEVKFSLIGMVYHIYMNTDLRIGYRSPSVKEGGANFDRRNGYQVR